MKKGILQIVLDKSAKAPPPSALLPYSKNFIWILADTKKKYSIVFIRFK